jgi:hypothetical protein
MTKKYCPNCGKQIVPGVKKCGWCEHPLDDSVIDSLKGESSVDKEGADECWKHLSLATKCVFIVFFILSAIGGFIIGGIVFVLLVYYWFGPWAYNFARRHNRSVNWAYSWACLGLISLLFYWIYVRVTADPEENEGDIQTPADEKPTSYLMLILGVASILVIIIAAIAAFVFLTAATPSAIQKIPTPQPVPALPLPPNSHPIEIGDAQTRFDNCVAYYIPGGMHVCNPGWTQVIKYPVVFGEQRNSTGFYDASDAVVLVTTGIGGYEASAERLSRQGFIDDQSLNTIIGTDQNITVTVDPNFYTINGNPARKFEWDSKETVKRSTEVNADNSAVTDKWVTSPESHNTVYIIVQNNQYFAVERSEVKANSGESVAILADKIMRSLS